MAADLSIRVSKRLNISIRNGYVGEAENCGDPIECCKKAYSSEPVCIRLRNNQ